MKREAKVVKEIADTVRMSCAYGVYAGALGSMFLAGIFAVIAVAINVPYLNDASLFGTRQWSITLSLVVIIALSLAMSYALKERCGDLLTSDFTADDTDEVTETVETAEAVGVDDTDDEFPVLLGIITIVLPCLTALAWLGGMWGFCYVAGELDTAGFSVAEVVATEVLAAVVIGVVLNKVCKFETEGETH